MLHTPDAAGAADFYARLFGWSSRPGPYGKLLFTPDDRPFASVTDQRDASLARRGPSGWLPFLLVDEIEPSTARAEALGGAVWLPPAQGPYARFSIVRGATGELVGLWQTPSTPDGPSVVIDPRVCRWVELATPDPHLAARFYGDLLGWRVENVADYSYFSDGSTQFGGMIELREGWDDHAFLSAIGVARGDRAEIPPHWMPLFGVEDCDRFCDEAEQAGAHVLTAPGVLHAVGNHALLRDPFGVFFSVLSRG